MAKPTAIVVWFDDGTRYHIDPAAVKSIFLNEGVAASCGHHGPHHLPGGAGPITGPFNDTAGPPAGVGGGNSASGSTTLTAAAGTCYYVQGIVICP